LKAVIYRQYGGPDVVGLEDVARPVPKPNEVLVRVYATTVTSADWRARSLSMPSGFRLFARLVFGITGPRQPILGGELAGIVEVTGRDVTRFKVGDEVVAFTGGRFGCHAEYRTMAEDGMIALKPVNLSFEEAASISFGAVTALPFLRDRAKIRPGDRVLVVGASGSVGSAAVQLAKHFGAEVKGVTSTPNVALVKTLGAVAMIDYTKVDFATTGETWDIIFDTTGTVAFSRCEKALNPGGRLVAVQGSFWQWLGLGGPSRKSGKLMISGVVSATPHDFRFIADLGRTGELMPVIDRIYRLEEAAEAHAYVDTGRKRGSVVLRLASDRRYAHFE
jgi:NADPH:quinone reductase-like Zn-dependent oxidoreductase